MKTVKLLMIAIGLAFLSSCTNVNKKVELQYAKKDIESASYELTYFQDSEARMNEEPMTAQYKVNLPLEFTSYRNSKSVKSKITIPKTDVKIVLPTGQQTLDTRKLKNIKLDFDYTPSGNQKKVKLHDESMVIDYGDMLGGTLDWSFLLKYITPKLPGIPVKKNDTWNETLTLKRIEAGSKIEATLNITHKLTGFEKIDGCECAVIKSQINSNLDDTFEMMAVPWNIKGTLSGNMTWYFDYNQGLIAQLKIEEQSDGKVEASADEMNATYEQSSVIELNLLN